MQRWVFGYGSLIWRPGFAFERREVALLRGAHRQLCVYSLHHRGTPEKPGLVMGLERGGACRGMAYAVAESIWPEVYAYLQEREQRSYAYRETWRPIVLDSGERVEALTFVADRGHEQYAGALPPEEQLRLVRQGHGEMGPNADYVHNTARHLREMGLPDPMLEWLSAQLGLGSPSAALGTPEDADTD